jgi:putative DNA primase/helicase
MQREKTADRARGRWRSILPALGIDSNFLVNRHGPCPICGGDDRFRFDDKEGDGTWFCNRCRSGDGIKLVMRVRGVDFVAACALIDPEIGNSEPEQPRDEPDAEQVRRSMRQMGENAVPVALLDPVHRYLSRRLGDDIVIPSCLRTLRSCLYKDEDRLSYHPVMLASVRDVEGRAVALHRTFLTPDGHKADVLQVRKVIGKLPDGCAVRLSEPAHVMGIAEGIETALSASILHRIPVWAALNSGRLKAWIPPEQAMEIIIFGDNDTNCDGQDAAYALGKRLNRTITAQVLIPEIPGTDWNDVLQTQNPK